MAPQEGDHSEDFKKSFCKCERCKGAGGKWIPDRTYRDHKLRDRHMQQILQQVDNAQSAPIDDPYVTGSRPADESEEEGPEELACLSLDDPQLEEADCNAAPSDGDGIAPDAGDTAFAEVLPEQIQLIKLVVHLYNVASEASLSNNTITRLLSWAFGQEYSLAALLHPDWKLVFDKYGMPTSCDQVGFSTLSACLY
jgi:hypothetical protein